MVYQDYTTYTEQDPTGRYDVTVNEITVTNLIRSEENWIYKDFGVNYFGDLVHANKIFLSSTTWNSGIIYAWFISDDIGTSKGLDDALKDFICFAMVRNSSGQTELNVKECDGGDLTMDLLTNVISFDTDYYIKIVRNGSNISVYIYTDENRTNQVEGSPIGLSGIIENTFRYLFAVNSHGDNVYRSSGVISNLDIDYVDPEQTMIPNYFSNQNLLLAPPSK